MMLPVRPRRILAALLFVSAGCREASSPLGEASKVDGGARDAAPPDLGERDDGGFTPDAGFAPDGGPASDAGSDAGTAYRCGEDGGWCWAYGAPIVALDEAPSGPLMAGGRGGTLLRWWGGGWDVLSLPTSEDVTDLFVESPTSVWIAAGALWHFDGDRFRVVSRNITCRYLAGTAGDDLWAFGGCTPMHFDGAQWNPVPIPDGDLDAVFSMLPRGPSEAWASVTHKLDGTDLRFHDRILRFDGDEWRQIGPSFERVSSSLRYSMIEVEGAVIARDLLQGINLALEEDTWVPRPNLPSPEAPEGEHVVYARRGGFVAVDLECVAAVRVRGQEMGRTGTALRRTDGSRFCLSALGTIRRSTPDGWASSPYGSLDQASPAQLWGYIPPQAWAKDAEMAWGSGPRNVLRVQTQFEGGNPRGERLSHFDGNAWRVVHEGNQFFWDFAAAGGDRAWVIIGSQLRLFDGVELTEVSVPEDLGVARWLRAHTVESGETFFTASAGGVSAQSDALLIRHDGEGWSRVHRWTAGAPEHVQFEFTDLAGPTAQDLLLGATNRSGERVVLRRANGGWRPVSLGAAPSGGAEVFLQANARLWVDGEERRLDALGEAPIDTAPLEDASMGWGYRQPRMWVGPVRVWVLSRGRALYRTR